MGKTQAPRCALGRQHRLRPHAAAAELKVRVYQHLLLGRGVHPIGQRLLSHKTAVIVATENHPQGLGHMRPGQPAMEIQRRIVDMHELRPQGHHVGQRRHGLHINGLRPPLFGHPPQGRPGTALEHHLQLATASNMPHIFGGADLAVEQPDEHRTLGRKRPLQIQQLAQAQGAIAQQGAVAGRDKQRRVYRRSRDVVAHRTHQHRTLGQVHWGDEVSVDGTGHLIFRHTGRGNIHRVEPEPPRQAVPLPGKGMRENTPQLNAHSPGNNRVGDDKFITVGFFQDDTELTVFTLAHTLVGITHGVLGLGKNRAQWRLHLDLINPGAHFAGLPLGRHLPRVAPQHAAHHHMQIARLADPGNILAGHQGIGAQLQLQGVFAHLLGVLDRRCQAGHKRLCFCRTPRRELEQCAIPGGEVARSNVDPVLNGHVQLVGLKHIADQLFLARRAPQLQRLHPMALIRRHHTGPGRGQVRQLRRDNPLRMKDLGANGQRFGGEIPVIQVLVDQPAIDRIDTPGDQFVGMACGIVGGDKCRAQVAPHKPPIRLPVCLHPPDLAPQFTAMHHTQVTAVGQQMNKRQRRFNIGQHVADQLHAPAFGFGQLGKQGLFIGRVTGHILEHRAITGRDKQG